MRKVRNTDTMQVMSEQVLVQVSSRGQVTLPAATRRELGIESGDALVVRVEDGRLVLEPVAVVTVERYDDDRVAEFARAAEMTDEEIAEARAAWDV